MRTVSLAFVTIVLLVSSCSKGPSSKAPIKVGVLHSLTGTLGSSGGPVRDATLLAIDELNEKGGLLGRKLVPVVADARSDPAVAAREAQRLIDDEKVSVVFGLWSSAARKAVKPVVELRDHLLVYPLQYEGIEESANIVYTGAAPNQQILPAAKWCMDNLGKRLFLVGSDYVFPRAANAILRDFVIALRGEVVGEEYLLLGSEDCGAIVEKIAQARPNAILNTLNGTSNGAFFRELRKAGITPSAIPTVSFSLAEGEIRDLGAEGMAGDYAAWNYFQSIDRRENVDFVRRYKARYGADRVTSDPIESGYFGVHLWSQAVADAGTDDPREVRAHLGDQTFDAPGGLVSIDRETQHTWKTVRVGRIRPDGQVDVVWTSGKAIRPFPFPAHRSREDWEKLVLGMYEAWGHQWANPGR